ncbi:MAG: DNA internalization-related competence protein ComEC/Rec2 [Thermacetogeniaceae bacterium]
MPPLVLLTAIFALGILTAYISRAGSGWVLAAFITAIILLATAAFFFFQGKRGSFVWLLSSFFCLGFTWMGIDKLPFPPSLEPFLGHYVQVEGVVEGLPTLYPNRMVLVLDTPVVTLEEDRWQGQGKLQVVYYLQKEEAAGKINEADAQLRASLLPGKRVSVDGLIALPPKAFSPGEFDYRAYLERQNIFAQLTAKKITPLGAGERGLSALFALLRLRIENAIHHSLPAEGALFLEGILLGFKGGMTPEDRSIYQRTGVMHLFTVSGLHLGFVFIALLAAANLLKLKRFPTFILVTAGLWGYAGLIDFNPPVTRSAVMATVGLAAYLWQQRPNALNSLALAAFVLLLIDPSVLFEPGFQLSFAATWGIIYLAVPLGRYVSFPLGLREAVTVPLAAQLAILPLAAFYFQQAAAMGMIANILVVPLAGLVVYLGLAGMVLALAVPGILNPFFLTAGAFFYPIRWLLELLSALPGAAFLVPPPPLWLCLLYYISMLVLGWVLREGFTINFPHFRYQSAAARRLFPALLLVISCTAMLFTGTVKKCQGELEVTFINVGQGDAILVQTPKGRTMLIDAGGSPLYSSSTFDPGSQLVVPALAKRGIRKLDLLVNSHPHEDHLGGIPAVLDYVKVERFVAPPVDHPTPLVLKVQQQLKDKKIKASNLTAGAIKLDPSVEISVLWPVRPLLSGSSSDANNNSLVLYLRYGKITFLFTGDLEREALSLLASLNQEGKYPGGIRATVLKVPHHGSASGICQEFAAAVRPQFAVISTGKNSFGHPDKRTIRFWQEQGAKVLRTDKAGDITFTTDGVTLSLQN